MKNTRSIDINRMHIVVGCCSTSSHLSDADKIRIGVIKNDIFPRDLAHIGYIHAAAIDQGDRHISAVMDIVHFYFIEFVFFF